MGEQRRRPEGKANVGVLLGVSRVIDAINFRIGKILAWLILAAVIVSAVNAVIRKLFDISSNAWLELQWVLFGAVFLHRRVLDAARQRAHPHRHREQPVLAAHAQHHRRRSATPSSCCRSTIIMIITSYPFVTKSVLLNEQSMNAGGLPQWPAKMLILIGFILLFFQGISELIKRIAVMMRPHSRSVHTGGGVRAAAEAEVARLLAEAKAAEDQAKSR